MLKFDNWIESEKICIYRFMTSVSLFLTNNFYSSTCNSNEITVVSLFSTNNFYSSTCNINEIWKNNMSNLNVRFAYGFFV